jgi:predicted ATP-binding protein involved in virulence
MYKLKSIVFQNHPILGNLSLDFCDQDGKPVDTVILAGENGAGKSTLLDALYTFISGKADFKVIAEYALDTAEISFNAATSHNLYNQLLNLNAGKNQDAWHNNTDGHLDIRPMAGIYSDIDINFNAKEVSSITSMGLDSVVESQRSNSNLPTQINQLIIDIQALDDADIANAVRKNPEGRYLKGTIDERMSRFTNAFSRMFDNLSYSRIITEKRRKTILFQKNGIEIPIEALSSGEKQVVYRGCFLLKDVNALNGAFVFIDEPEISLHPTWQMRIMDYYKSIFTNAKGVQTSQLFVATHSPFIIHNETRKNDKVIVLSRDINGTIIVKDKPEYYKCTSIELIKDAFSISHFQFDKPTVFLEGRTDEEYFKKACEVFGFDIPFQFKWIGFLDDNNTEHFTGSSSLNQAYNFLAGQEIKCKTVFLFDCDTNKNEFQTRNLYVRRMPYFENSKKMKKGIENALVLDDIDISSFYKSKEKEGDYGERKIITEFLKMDCCRFICSLNHATLETVFIHLKETIMSLTTLFSEE